MNMASEEAEQQRIKRSSLVWRFRFYGFFKNLKFFEPFLLILLLKIPLSLFQIGILFFIREATTYLMEIPSGIIADKFGRKRILMACFLLYIVSFLCYFFGLEIQNLWSTYLLLGMASIFFGLGEAARSGSHKAMELMWLERENLAEYKAFLYGTTRSFSLIGAALSALLGIAFALVVPAKNWIFIITIIPYLIDFALIASYPQYMNQSELKKEKGTLNDQSTEHNVIQKVFNEIKQGFQNIKESLKEKQLRCALVSSSLFDAIFKSIKDYIQPIMNLYIFTLLIRFNLSAEHQEESLTVSLGVIYFLFYIISSFSSKNAYQIKKWFQSAPRVMNIFFDIFAFIMLLIGIFTYTKFPLFIIICYLFLYILENARRPNAIDFLGEIIPSSDRATFLSVENQLKAIFMLIFALLFGFIAELNIGLLFILIAVFMVLINRFIKI